MLKMLGLINVKLWGIVAGVALLLCVITGVVSYQIGQSNAEVECAKVETERVRAQAIYVHEAVIQRVPVVEYVEKENTKLVKELAVTKEKLNEAIGKREDSPACGLLDDERLRFNEAARGTTRAADLYSGGSGRSK